MQPLARGTVARILRAPLCVCVGSGCAFVASLALAQPIDPVPRLDFGESQKGVAVTLDFTGATTATPRSVAVFFGRAHGRASAPPMLSVELLDVGGNARSSFNAWHPLWTFVRNDAGHDGAVVRSHGTGHIVFPFAPDLATLKVSDKASASEIVSVDLVSPFHDFCRAHRSDADCGHVVNRPPRCAAGGPYPVECAGATTTVALDGTRSIDPDQDPLSFAWSGPFATGTAIGPAPVVRFTGVGRAMVTLALHDDFGGSTACTSTVDVADTLPPIVERASASPGVLWPPNHKMVPVEVSVASSDVCDAAVACRIASVTSNEDPGNKSTARDWEITGDLSLQLRAERSGTGGDRTYQIAVECRDDSGNVTAAQALVSVPHDQRK